MGTGETRLRSAPHAKIRGTRVGLWSADDTGDRSPARTRPFALVFAGGGARGYAHAGVLRGLEHLGFTPVGLVGVSMGAVVAATRALRDDWYDALVSVDLSALPGPPDHSGGVRTAVLRRAVDYAHSAWNMLAGWGAPSAVAAVARAALDELVGAGKLEEARIPVVVCATDLLSGKRIDLRSGDAASAVYASSAIAGVLPPLEVDEYLLVDGVYADMAPTDVARGMGAPVVIAVDPSQAPAPGRITNGLQTVMRAMEVCHHAHAGLRLRDADLVLRPKFDTFIDALDFAARRHCIAAGIAAVRSNREAIERLLRPAADSEVPDEERSTRCS